MNATLLERPTIRGWKSREKIGEEAVHHHVGVTPDGRREMGVILKRKAIMAYVFGSIHCLRHAPHREEINERLGLFTPHGTYEIGKLLARDVLRIALKGMPHHRHNVKELRKLLPIRAIMHPVDEWTRLLAIPWHAEHFSNRTISQQHKLLNQLMRFVIHLRDDFERFAAIIEPELNLLAHEIDSPILKTSLADGLGNAAKHSNRLRQGELLALNGALRLIVGESGSRFDYSPPHPLPRNVTLLVKIKNYRKGKLLLIGPQRTDAIAQPFGKHRHGAIH